MERNFSSFFNCRILCF